MLTRAEALAIVSAVIADMNSEKDSDHQLVVREERTVERDLVIAFCCNTKKYIETRNPRHAIYGIGPIIVNKRTGRVKVCGSNRPFLKIIDDYERRAVTEEW